MMTTMNPILRLAFPPPCQISFHLENLSEDTSLIYKVKTAVSKLNLFNISPIYGEVKPKSHTNITVICNTPNEFPNEFPISGLKFSVCSKVIQPGENIYWHSEHEYRNEFMLKYDHQRGMMMAESKDQPSLNQMQKHQNVCGIGPKAKNYMLQISLGNGTVKDELPISSENKREKEEVRKAEASDATDEIEDRQEERKKEDEKTGLCSMVFGISTTTVMFFLSIYPYFGESAVWNWITSLVKELGILVEDPDITYAHLEQPVNLNQFFWMITTAVLFLAVIFGKKRLAFLGFS